MNQRSNSFKMCCSIEAKGMIDICKYIDSNENISKHIEFNAGPKLLLMQRTFGDSVLYSGGEFNCVDFKVEKQNKYGNFFIEMWSNKSKLKPGWIFTLKTDFIFYYFLEEKELYIIPFERLQYWCFTSPAKNGTPGKVYDYPERKQSKYNQKNDTWGRCVPIHVLAKDIGIRKEILTEEIEMG